MKYSYQNLYLTIGNFSYRYFREDYFFPGAEIKLKDNSVNYVYIEPLTKVLNINNTGFPDNKIKIGIFQTANNNILDIHNYFIDYTFDGQTGTVSDLIDISYDNDNSNLTATNGQTAVDEIQNDNPGMQFDITNTTSPVEGQLNWNIDDGTLQFGLPGGNWQIISVDTLTGNKFIQTASPTGNYLSAVSSDDSLSGTGTVADPLKVTGLFSASASLTPTVNGDVSIEATNNTTLTLKLKGSDGTVRTTTLTLS